MNTSSTTNLSSASSIRSCSRATSGKTEQYIAAAKSSLYMCVKKNNKKKND